MNRYLAKLASLDEKRAYPGNPQNPQNPPKRGFEGFEGSPSSDFLRSATSLTEAEAIPHRETAAGICETAQAEHFANPYASALAALRAECPDYVPVDRWHQAIADATAFISEWAAQAQAFAWSARELFGLHPVPERPAANYSRLSRVDALGLIWLLRGRPVTALTSTEAVMRCHSGASLTYTRTDPAPAAETVTSAVAEIAKTETATSAVVEIAKRATA
jgi:hypothetical protein